MIDHGLSCAICHIEDFQSAMRQCHISQMENAHCQAHGGIDGDSPLPEKKVKKVDAVPLKAHLQCHT
ncbi:MAG: hypothetical protein U1E36_09225 [Rickettsiales bacterium]